MRDRRYATEQGALLLGAFAALGLILWAMIPVFGGAKALHFARWWGAGLGLGVVFALCVVVYRNPRGSRAAPLARIFYVLVPLLGLIYFSPLATWIEEGELSDLDQRRALQYAAALVLVWAPWVCRVY